jgi:hypothetical protein
METAYSMKELTYLLELYKQRYHTDFRLSERQFSNESGEWNMSAKELKRI